MRTASKPDSSSNDIENVEAAYREYIKHFPKKAISLKSTIFRYFLPYRGFGLNFDVQPGKQIKAAQMKRAWDLANQINLSDLWEIERVLTWQEEIFDSINASTHVRKPNKHYLKHFLEWCKEQGYLKPPTVEEWTVPQSLPGYSKAYHRNGGRERHLIVSREPIIEYGANLEILLQQKRLELHEFSAFWSDQHYEGIRPIPKLISKREVQKRLERLSYLIGWLVLDKLDYHRQMCERAKHRKEKDPNHNSVWLPIDSQPPSWLAEMQQKYPPLSLESLELDDLIPLINIHSTEITGKPSLKQEDSLEQDTYDELLTKIDNELKAQNAVLGLKTTAQLAQALYRNQSFAKEVRELNQINAEFRAKREAEAQMQEACIKVRSLLKNFYRWLQYQHNPLDTSDGYRISPSHRANLCNTLMNLAKFRYREITKPRKSPDYSDIDIVIELRNVRKEETSADFLPNAVSSIKRNPTWTELGKLLKDLLVACAPRRQIEANPDYTTMGPMRAQSAVAKDFQKYLIMMFFRVVAPDRQHVVRELQQHNTLKLCWLNWETRHYEEAPWDKQNKRYEVYYNAYTKLYYLDVHDAKDEKGNPVQHPSGKAFSWVVFLSPSQTKIDQDNAYRVPKIYNPELESWLNGREDFSGVWFNWPKIEGTQNNKWSKSQYHWCGYVDVTTGKQLGFRETFHPSHDFVFTQTNGKPFSQTNMCRFYDAILWRFLTIRSNPHAIRSAAVAHFKLKGMTDAQSESLAKLKSHSLRMQNSSTYNKLGSIEKTALASEMIVSEFLQEYRLDPKEYGLVGGIPSQDPMD